MNKSTLKQHTAKCVLFVFLLFLSCGLISQTYLGFFVGINNGKLKGDAPRRASYKSSIGFNGGIYLDVKVSKLITLSFQPTYTQEGARVFYTVPDQKEPVDSLRIRLNYFAIPILVKVSSLNQRFYALAGVETGFLLDGYAKYTETEEQTSLTDEIAQINLSVVFGAGLRFPLKFGRIYLELRYAQSIIDLTDEEVDESYVPRIKTAGTRLNVGYEIPLSKRKK
jgi:hypothetical protein